MLKASLKFAGASVLALMAASGAMAQDGGVPPAATTPAADGQAAPQAAASAGVEDIVVTAQRRAENVQQASLSIEAISAEALATRGITDSQSLNDVVPGLKISYAGAQVQTFIRGVGDATSQPYTQASVSLNMDGVYIARSSVFGSIFFDTARVEVLRGPQGTLYGRNSSGGAINIISNGPKLGEFSGYAVGEVGNYDLVRVQGAINVPVSETLAIRAAAQVVHRDGYLSDGSSNDRSQAGRLRALWEPTSALTIGIITEVAHVGGQGYGRTFRPALFGDPWTGPNDKRLTPALFPTLRLRNRNTFDSDFIGVSSELNWDLGGPTLTVLPAYRYVKTDGDIAADFRFANFETSHQKSLEARLSGDLGRLKYVVGGYYFKEDLKILIVNDQRLASNLSGNFQTQDVPVFDTEAYAAFGEGTYSLTDSLRAIGGLRYTEETRTRVGKITTTPNLPGGVPGVSGVQSFNSSLDVNAVTWRVGAEFDLAAANMLYATISKGFKSGGFDATGPDAFRPEYLRAYTLGSKNRFFGNTLQLNLEAFYWEYSDQQIGFVGVDSRGITSFITLNPGQAKIYGGNLDIVWRPTPNDTLDAGVEFLKTNYDDFRFNTIGNFVAGTLLADGCVSDGLVAGAPGQYTENCTGKPLPRSPRWSGNVRYAHRFDLSSGANISVSGTMKFASSHFLNINYLSPNFRQGSYQTFDADITYRPASDRWSLQAYARNITDKAVYLSAVTSASIPPTSGPSRSSSAAIGLPMTYGARFQFNF